MYCRGGEIIYLYLSRFLAETTFPCAPHIRTQIKRRKIESITYIPPVYTSGIQKNWVTPQNGPNYYHKHLQLIAFN